ncbi:MAG: hypothetical protein ACOZJZ_07400 [Pseudomonadota bacterium]
MDRRLHRRLKRAPAAAGAWLCCLAACSPALNWREVTPAESGASVMFPCKPDSDVRQVPLAGAPVALSIHACRAGDVTYALSHADVADPARVGPALEALAAAAAANLGGTVVSQRPVVVEGMTPHPQARLIELQGRLPDGRPVNERAALFSKGTRVFQATMFGAALEAEASETFFGALRLP